MILIYNIVLIFVILFFLLVLAQKMEYINRSNKFVIMLFIGLSVFIVQILIRFISTFFVDECAVTPNKYLKDASLTAIFAIIGYLPIIFPALMGAMNGDKIEKQLKGISSFSDNIIASGVVSSSIGILKLTNYLLLDDGFGC